MSRILAVYGTAYGQTEKIVRRMAARLIEGGHTVTVVKGDELPPALSLDDHDAFLIGASVIAGRHQRYMRAFVRRHLSRLNAAPSAFVSVCGSAAGATAKERELAQSYVAQFLRETGWRPRLTTSVAGAIAYTRYGFFLRWIVKRMSGRTGGPTDTSRDHELTDWQVVDAFARQIGESVAQVAGITG
jgi:menaquinone-dependent protoporphyrinogen oxidase